MKRKSRGFQEELKAYARYLVRGETPFWKQAKGSDEYDVLEGRTLQAKRTSRLVEVELRIRREERYEEERRYAKEQLGASEWPSELGITEEYTRQEKSDSERKSRRLAGCRAVAKTSEKRESHSRASGEPKNHLPRLWRMLLPLLLNLRVFSSLETDARATDTTRYASIDLRLWCIQ